MALKRPTEKKWNFKKVPEPFPQVPGANGCFLAPSGGGKTTTLISLLLGPYKHVFEEVHVWSPSVNIDSAWDPVKEFGKGLKRATFNDEWNEGELAAVLDAQRSRVAELKKAKTTKPIPQILTIVDDFTDRYDIVHAAGNILTTLFIRGRHFGSSCWLASQKLTALSTVARVNFRFMLVWRLRNQKEIFSLMEELSAIYDVRTLYEMYEMAVADEYSFWYINLIAKKKEDMFHIRFEERLILANQPQDDTPIG